MMSEPFPDLPFLPPHHPCIVLTSLFHCIIAQEFIGRNIHENADTARYIQGSNADRYQFTAYRTGIT